MTYQQTYSELYAYALTQEQHERTCGYWFTVTNGAMAHTAFATRAGLDRWLAERGLALEGELPAAGTRGVSRIIGEYRTALHGVRLPQTGDEWPGMGEGDEWGALVPVLATATLGNGEYTLALITEEADGVRTVHTLNCNVHSRVVFDRAASRRWLES